MTPLMKRLIIAVNIIVYIAVGIGIYAKKKGGFKELVPHKKLTMAQIAAAGKTNITTTAKAPVQVAVASTKKAIVAAAANKPEVKPVPASAAPVLDKALLAQLPPHIQETEKLLEEMKVKEKFLSFTYFAGMHRDPFMPLVGIDQYLASLKLSADELADLPYGLSEEGKKKASPFTLMGTVTSQTGEAAAIINDQLVYKGDIIDGYEVQEISGRKVALKKGKREIKLEMPSYESETATLQKLGEGE